jgi:hypothetical protein
MDDKKFEIEGNIEGTEETPKRRSITGRFFLFMLVVVVVGSIWYFPFLQDEFPALKKITMGSNAVTAADSTLLKETYENKLKIDSLIRVNDSLQKANQILLEQSNDYTGLFYEIQIGIFNNFDIEKYKQQMTALRAEITTDGTKKLTLGKFRSLKTAKEFLLDVRKMGFKDAWIVAKQDGERIPFDNEVINRDLP